MKSKLLDLIECYGLLVVNEKHHKLLNKVEATIIDK